MKNSLRSGLMNLLPMWVILLLIVSTTIATAQTTTLFSSGFEPADPQFTYATNPSGQGSNMPFFGNSTINPRTGAWSGRAEGGTGTTPRIYGSIVTPQLVFEPGYTYTITLWSRVDATNQPVNLEVRRAGTDTHAALTAGTVVLNQVSVNSTTYTQYSATFTVPTTTSQYIGIIVERATNGGAINVDNVTITQTCIPITANAGSNINTCATSAGLAATPTAPWQTGTWSVVSGSGTFSNINNPNATVTNLGQGNNVFLWTVTQGSCTPATSTVTVTQGGPVVTSNPSSHAICAGDNTSFSVVASNATTYQWQLNGFNLTNTGNYSGVNTPTLNISSAGTAQAGTYTVVVSGPCPPTVTSAGAVLTIDDAPAINIPPQNQTICAGETLNLDVNASGSNLSYQWRRNGTNLVNGGNISGATSASLTITNSSTANAGTYDVVVSNPGCPSITSTGAVVTVTDGPMVTSNPAGQTVCEGSTVNFTITATGDNLSYQWRRNGVNLANSGNVSGANTPSLTLTNVAGPDIGNYDVVVSNPLCPNDTSSSAGLIVQFAPVIQAHPLNEVACDGGSASLSVVATGSGVTYQWRKDGVNLTTGPNIADVNSATLVINPFMVSDTGTYDVIIDGTCGTPTPSNTATITLGTPVTPSVSITASDNPVCDSITVFFVASPVEGGFFPAYQWYVNNVAQNINNDTLALLGLQTGDEIYVELTSSADCPVPPVVTSNTVTMTVTPLDSTCIPVVSLLPQYCPFTQNNIMDLVEVERVYDANAYQYRIENAVLGFSAAPIRSLSNTCCPYVFGMNMLNGLKFNTTYEVSVRVRVGGVWGSYGPTCEVTTPPFPQISLLPSSCNVTIPTMSTLLFSEILYNVTNYRYQITGPGGFSAIYVRGSGSNAFSLAWVPGIQYATTYDIRVEAFVNGDWGGYGPICQVTTPAQIPTTQLSAGSCNITLSSMNQILSSDVVPGATNYRYRITQPGFTAVYNRNSSSNLFSIGWLNSIQYGQTYNVEVAAMVGGVWANYGNICTVTTPTSLPTTQLASGSCNITLNNLNTLLFSNPVANAQDYQYRIIDSVSGFNQIYQRGSGSNAFSMSWVPGLAFNTTYHVEVRANVGGTWGSFGPACTVTTPANIPTTQLEAQWCNTTLISTSQIISSVIVPNATNYQYHIFDGSGFNTTINRGSSSNLFSLGWVPGIQGSTTYNVEVRAMVGGVWGNFGPVCSLTTPVTPSAPSRISFNNNKTETFTEVNVYPNPAHSFFNIEFTREAQSSYTLKMYDMSDRIVYNDVNASAAGNNLININIENLNKGIYLIVLDFENERIQKQIVVN